MNKLSRNILSAAIHIIPHRRLICCLGLGGESAGFYFELRFDFLCVRVRKCLSFAGVRFDFGAIQGDPPQLHELHLTRQ